MPCHKGFIHSMLRRCAGALQPPLDLPACCGPARPTDLQDLGCAKGKAAAGQGCTACPAGKKLQPIKPQFLLNSTFIQFQAVGKACY